MTIRRPLRVAFALLLPLAATGCRLGAQEVAERMVDRTLSVDPAVTLDIRTGSGNIAIRSGSSGAVRVIARIQGRGWPGGDVEERVRRLEANPPIEQDGGVVRIGHIADRDLVRNIRISYEVTAPVETAVRSRTGSGDQTIAGVRGPVAARTGSGTIDVRHIQADVDATTGSGDITGDDLRAGFAGRAGSGSIRVDGIGGAASARTGSGDVALAQTADGDVDITTASGSIEVTGARQALRARAASGDIRLDGRPGRDWDVASSSGSIRVRFPADSAFELSARTASGGVEVGHPITVAGASTRARVRGTVRGGGPRVAISAASGSIHVN